MASPVWEGCCARRPTVLGCFVAAASLCSGCESEAASAAGLATPGRPRISSMLCRSLVSASERNLWTASSSIVCAFWRRRARMESGRRPASKELRYAANRLVVVRSSAKRRSISSRRYCGESRRGALRSLSRFSCTVCLRSCQGSAKCDRADSRRCGSIQRRGLQWRKCLRLRGNERQR